VSSPVDIEPPLPARLRALAGDVARLTPSRTDPERYHIAKSEIVEGCDARRVRLTGPARNPLRCPLVRKTTRPCNPTRPGARTLSGAHRSTPPARCGLPALPPPPGGSGWRIAKRGLALPAFDHLCFGLGAGG
jgi:hypothetical protein